MNHSLVALSGEGSHQEVEPRETPALSTAVWNTFQQTPSAIDSSVDPTYYGRPLLKAPVWRASIPLYFYTGGVAGASAVLGWMAQTIDGRELEDFVQRCRWISAAAVVVSSGLLVEDLGRPSRFLHMLRVFRPTSPMSVGSWVLTVFGGAITQAAVLGQLRGKWKLLADGSGAIAGLMGLPLATYTAVLISNTAVPLWQGGRHWLPGVFAGSAMTSTAAILETQSFSERESRIADAFGCLGGVVEIGSMYSLERELAEVDYVAKPLREGVNGALWTTAKILCAASLVLSIAPKKSRKWKNISAAVGTLGALCTRFAIFRAGISSAADPRATFRQQRSGHGAAEIE